MNKIFYGDEDNRDFNNPDRYAFLNWRMDDGLGTHNRIKKEQMVSGFYNMGRGYLGNALISLYVLNERNMLGVADIVCFPILFDIWHGTELWLKSVCMALELVYEEEVYNEKPNHYISKYYERASKFMEDKGLEYVTKEALIDVGYLISEFERVDAKIDFARYSFDRKDNYQFYNAPYSDNRQWQQCIDDMVEIVPNTCLDLCATFELILKMFISFGRFVEYMYLLVQHGEKLTDQGYVDYIKHVEHSDRLFDKNQNEDMLDMLLREIS